MEKLAKQYQQMLEDLVRTWMLTTILDTGLTITDVAKKNPKGKRS